MFVKYDEDSKLVSWYCGAMFLYRKPWCATIMNHNMSKRNLGRKFWTHFPFLFPSLGVFACGTMNCFLTLTWLWLWYMVCMSASLSSLCIVQWRILEVGMLMYEWDTNAHSLWRVIYSQCQNSGDSNPHAAMRWWKRVYTYCRRCGH